MASVLPLPDERDRKIPGALDKPEVLGEPANDLDVEMQADGSALVRDPLEEEEKTSAFDVNLAEEMEEVELDKIAKDLMERIDLDKRSRSKRDEQYAEGLRRTGLGDDAPGGAQFAGASRVVHPMLAEAAVDFGASAMRELFPPSGPVRTKITGSQTQEQLKIAERQNKYMNWQLTTQMVEYADELAQTLTQVPMGGSQYMKFFPDDSLRRAVSQFVPVDDVLLPYGCNSFWGAHRITHVQRLTEPEYEERTETEMYRELPEADASAMVPDATKSGQASERIEGVEPPQQNIDGLRIVYEVNTFCKISLDKDKRLPYLVTIDERTSKICSIYRNWEEQDETQERLHWLVDFSFIPWRGAIKMGLPQLIGGLSAAATGSLRALLDSALVNTIPVLAKLKSAKLGGQAKTMNPLEAVEVEAGTNVDDIRKALMPIPFNPPSLVLYQLLEWITAAAKGTVSTATEKIAEASSTMPMGTALALIEQGAKLFSSIHAGLHRSQAKALEIIGRINKDFLSEKDQIRHFGEVICTREDFKHPLGVIPVSDPNIFSEGQRYAQMHLVQQTAVTYPQLHNLYEMVRSSYQLAKIPESDIDRILPKPKQPTELNAAAENSSVMLGNPIMAFPEQDHLAHLETHMRFVTDPLMGGNPSVVPKTWPQMLEHIKQHLAFLYAKEMHDLVTAELGQDFGEFIKDKKNWQKGDQLLAAASKTVHAKLMMVLQPLGPLLQQMLQQITAMQPPGPMDPSVAALKVAQLEDQRKRGELASKERLDGQKLDELTAKDLAAGAARAEELRIKDKDVSLRHGVAADNTELGAQKQQLDRQRLEHERQAREEEAKRAAAEHAQRDDHFHATRADSQESGELDRMSNLAESDAARAHQSGQSERDRAHQSGEAHLDRTHQSIESEASRAAEAERAKEAAAAAAKKPKKE